MTNPKSLELKLTQHGNISITSIGGSTAFNDTYKSDLKVKYYHRDKTKLGIFLVQLKVVFKL